MHVSLHGFEAQSNERYAFTYDMQTKHDVHKVSAFYVHDSMIVFRSQYAQNEHAIFTVEKNRMDMTYIPALIPVIIILY